MNKLNKRPKQLLNVIALAMMAILFFSTGCSKQTATKQGDASEITVAAAANLTDVFAEIGKVFTEKTGVRVTFSFGATADLGKQIENGGPFDVFAAADVDHVDDLVDKGSLVRDTRKVYAQGRLVLWKPPQSHATLTTVEDVKAPNVKFIAVAKPDVAPYGRATVEALEALNIWTDVEPKVVYAQNVAQTKQQAASGNADLAFLPLALMKPGEGQYIEVPAKLYQPINQAMAVVKASGKQQAAKQFEDFIMSAEGQAIFEKFGYLKPAAVE